jgi:hypothetical protein
MIRKFTEKMALEVSRVSLTMMPLAPLLDLRRKEVKMYER